MDDDDLDLDVEDPDPVTQDSSVIRDLRRRLREAQGKVKQGEADQVELQALREFRTGIEQSQRTQTAEAAFTALGMSPKPARLFLKDHEGEVTEAAVQAWVQANELVPPQEEEPPSPRFTPTAAGRPPKETIDRATFNAWMSDPARVNDALKAYDEGRVEPLSR